MAVTKAPAKKQPAKEFAASEKAPAKKPSKGIVPDVSALLLAGKEAEDKLRAQTGGTGTWITVVQAGAGYVTQAHPDYVKGLKEGQFYIKDKGIKLATIKGTILGMFPVYAQIKESENKQKDEMPQTLGFWHPDDAVQIPKVDGDNFTRELKDGTKLVPMHWIFFRIDGHEDVKEILLPFRSTGNSYYKAIEKAVKKASKICCELRVEIKTTPEYNKDWNKTYFYPVAEIIGRNFTLLDDGTVEAGEADSDAIAEIAEEYADLQKRYNEGGILSRRSPAQLLAALPPGAGAPRALPGASGGYEDGDASDGEVESDKPAKKGKAARF